LEILGHILGNIGNFKEHLGNIGNFRNILVNIGKFREHFREHDVLVGNVGDAFV
jgi:hypothetical protein